jgi:hypothetical protein
VILEIGSSDVTRRLASLCGCVSACGVYEVGIVRGKYFFAIPST